MDRIRIRGVRCWARVGVPEEERRRRQEIRVDLDLGLNLKGAGRTGSVERTVDYAAVTRQVRLWVEGKAFCLAEAVAEEVAGRILQQFGPEEVRVRVAKFSVPGTESVGVEVTRRKSRTRSGSPRAGPR